MSYSSTILADSPIRYYRLDEAAYKVADASGNNHHGAASSGGLTYGVGSLVGNSDTCLTFDGSSGVIIGSPFGLPSGSSPAFSIELWMKFASNPGGNEVLAILGAWSGTDGPYIGLNNAGKPFIGTHNIAGPTASSALSTGAPHHLVHTYDGTTGTLYIDGVSAGTYTGAISLTPFATIGRLSDGTTWFAGQIAQVAIYNYKLTATQVANHHSGTGSGYDATILADTPVSYWKLSDSANGSTVITDSSTSAQNGTMAANMASAPGLLVGDSDTAYLFTGLHSATIPSTGLPTGSSHFSIEAWIEIVANPTSNGVFLSIGSGTTPNGSVAELYVNTSGQIAVSVAGTDTGLSSAISLNTRHHIVGTWDGTTLRCYVDGSQTGTSLPTMNLTAHAGAIGGDANGGTFFIGIVDEVAIYSTTLSSTQVTNHYNAGANPTVNLSATSSEPENDTGKVAGALLTRVQPRYGLYVRSNSTLALLGKIDNFISLVGDLRFNDVSSLAVALHPFDAAVPLVVRDNNNNWPNGLLLFRDNQDGNPPQLLFSGPITLDAINWDISQGGTDNLQVIVTASSDDVALEDRSALPIPNTYYWQSEVLNDSPLRFYRFNETSGTTATDTSGHQNGTYSGGVTLLQDPIIDEEEGYSIVLNGTSGTISVPTTGLPTGSANWSIMAWVTLSAVPAATAVVAVFGNWGTTKAAPHIGIDTSGYAYAGTFAGDTTHYPVNLADGVVHQLMATWDGTNLTLYVDGLQREVATPGALSVTLAGAAIGSNGGGGNWFGGGIDEVCFYNSCIASNEVQYLYLLGVNRFAYKNSTGYDTRTGQASTIMWQYVNVNAGPGAFPERQVTGLTMASDPGIGGVMSESVRLHNLLTVSKRESLRANPELGFRVIQTVNAQSNVLQFLIFQPRNQTSVALFSPSLGNIAQYNFVDAGPVANMAFVGGAGTLVNRLFAAKKHKTSISRTRRREKFYDHRNLNTTRDLKTQGDAHLTEEIDQQTLSFQAIDTPSLVAFRDYFLGDLITVVIDNIPHIPNIVMEDVIREIRITLQKGANGNLDEQVLPMIGVPGASRPLSVNRAANKALKANKQNVDDLATNY